MALLGLSITVSLYSLKLDTDMPREGRSLSLPLGPKLSRSEKEVANCLFFSQCVKSLTENTKAKKMRKRKSSLDQTVPEALQWVS